MRIARRIGYFLVAIMFVNLVRAVGFRSILSVVGLLVLMIVLGLALGMIFDRQQVKAVANRPAHFVFASFLPDGQILIL